MGAKTLSARIVTLGLAAISMVIAIPLTAQLWMSLPSLISEQWFDPFMWGALIGGLCGAFIFSKECKLENTKPVEDGERR